MDDCIEQWMTVGSNQLINYGDLHTLQGAVRRARDLVLYRAPHRGQTSFSLRILRLHHNQIDA